MNGEILAGSSGSWGFLMFLKFVGIPHELQEL
jgi:hypothetical protein